MPGQRKRRPSGNCGLCGTWRRSLHRDHIIPRWKGGTDEIANIQWICANCHEDKTREDLKGMPGPNKGRVFGEESRRKMSESSKLRQDRGGYTKGRHLTDEHRRKISESLCRAFKEHPKVMPPASENRRRKVSESLRRYHANREIIIEPLKKCKRCLEVKDVTIGFYWRKSPRGRLPCAICKRCKNTPKSKHLHQLPRD